MPKPRSATSYKLPPDAKDALDRMAEKLDMPKTYVLAQAIREMADRVFPSGPKKNGKKV